MSFLDALKKSVDQTPVENPEAINYELPQYQGYSLEAFQQEIQKEMENQASLNQGETSNNF